MEESITGRLKAAWNAFLNRDPTEYIPRIGMSSSSSPHKKRLSGGNERSIVSSVYTQCAIDVASIRVEHVRLDAEGRYTETISSSLNDCLTVEANIDQSSRAFMQDVVMSMFDEGHVAIVPVDTNINPNNTEAYEVLTMRTGKVVEWFPRHVRIRMYNDRAGRLDEIVMPKTKVAIVENPLYAVMNEPNSTLQRLIRKLNILDAIDEQSGSGKLDLLIQFPFTIKSEARKLQAEGRRKDIEDQLTNTKYGIAYTDATEKVIQLNRPVENNLMGQIEYLTRTLYSQLGLTETIFNGTANEATMINYWNRTLEPVVGAVIGELKRKFISKTARTRGHSIMAFRNVFGLISAKDLAELVDKFSRNEVATGNEFRSIIGFKPSTEPTANELRNKNINQQNGSEQPPLQPQEGVINDS